MAQEQREAMRQLAPQVRKKEEAERVLDPLLETVQEANRLARRFGAPQADALRAAFLLRGIRSDPMGDLGQRILESSQRQADDIIRQQSRLADTARELSDERAAAEQEDDKAEVDRIAREQRSVDLAELTLNAAEAIRSAVTDAIVAGSESQSQMRKLTWGLIVFAAITMIASIAAAVAAIVSAASHP